MARHKEFDRDSALALALDVFWENGYGNTSTDVLLGRMKISRQSLYDTFGDKKHLYLEALKAYTEKSIGEAIRHLNKPQRPLAGIEEMLVALASKPAKERVLGCMGVNAVCECGSADPDVMNAMAEPSGRLMEALQDRLREAKAQGEVADDLDESGGAMFVNSIMNAIRVSARAGAPKPALVAMAKFTLDGIRRRQ